MLVRTSGKKKEDALVARVKNYQKIPHLRIRENNVDPDVFTKSKLEKMGFNEENIFNIPGTTALNREFKTYNAASSTTRLNFTSTMSAGQFIHVIDV